jgi:uncharacterized protein YjbJ (UPF0337 family)
MEDTVDERIDDLKGRAKEAAGDLADDPELKREGRADRAAGQAKAKAGELADKAHDELDAAKDKVKDVVERARKGAKGDR